MQRIEQDDEKADGLLLGPVARMFRVAHIGALHIEVHHAFFGRPRHLEENIVLRLLAFLGDDFHDKEIALA